MTHADLLNRMELIDAELETGSGEDDEISCLLALDVAQDYFESLASSYPKMFRTYSSLTTTANTETTAYPAAILRLDELWLIDTTVTPNRPSYPLRKTDIVGGHVPALPWPFRASNFNPGAPSGYDVDESYFYWAPTPDAVYTIRYYGMVSQATISTRGGTFAYKDHLAMPFAAFAVRAKKIGLEDGSDALKALADELFEPALTRARRFDRAGHPSGRAYSRVHST